VIRSILAFFRREELGQDLAEYCLITALVALVGLGIFIHMAGGVQALWNTANSTLATGNSSNGAGVAATTSH
jgi:Flp pilus assembly pilin Flp